jgi:hypothetical protein
MTMTAAYKVKLSAQRKLDRQMNPAKYRIKDKKNRIIYKIQRAESSRKWRAAHKLEIAARSKKWREENKETIYQDQKEYRSRSFKTMLMGKMRTSKTLCRKKGRIFEIDLKYILDMLEQQNHRCKLTNIKLTHVVGPKCVSIDRIDSSLGYIKGNIQLVYAGINLAKKDYSNDEIITLVKEIKNHEN